MCWITSSFGKGISYIRTGRTTYRTNNKRTHRQTAASLTGTAVFFYSTIFCLFQLSLTKNTESESCGASEKSRMRFFSAGKRYFLPFHRGRSPPFNLNFQQKIRIGGIRNDRESSETEKRQI